MPKRLHKMDLLEILSGLVSGELIESIGDDGERSMEEQYLIGTALSQIGADIQKAAKEEALTSYRGVKGKQLEGRLIIEWRSGGEQTRVDTAIVKKLYPPEERPELWKKVATKESIAISVGECAVPVSEPPPS